MEKNDQKCVWEWDDKNGGYRSTCGKDSLLLANMEDGEIKFCMFCGKSIEIRDSSQTVVDYTI